MEHLTWMHTNPFVSCYQMSLKQLAELKAFIFCMLVLEFGFCVCVLRGNYHSNLRPADAGESNVWYLSGRQESKNRKLLFTFHTGSALFNA